MAISKDAANILAPTQLGVGISGACESVIHSINNIINDANTNDTDKLILQLDLSNTFNVIDRKHAFLEVRDTFPQISHWVEASYGIQAELIFGHKTILSCQGFHQGDNLASVLYGSASTNWTQKGQEHAEDTSSPQSAS